MSSFEHSRFVVFNRSQHPYRHTLDEFIYTNPIVPNVTQVDAALNYIFAVLYPKSIGSFADMATLLSTVPAPNPNDYAYIQDDGDGHGAGYVYQVIDGVGAWHKRYDVDWSMEAILAETMNRTQYMYVQKYGMSDNDATGVPLTGLFAGQHIYGGDLAGQHLTLHANSADTLGTITGWVQTEAGIRPLQDATFDLGTGALRWNTVRAATSFIVGTMTVGPGSIIDSTTAITFGNSTLTTTGNLFAAQGTFSGTASINGTLTLSTGNIVDSGGAIAFGSNNLTTTGTITAAAGSKLADITFNAGAITSATPTISFGANNLATTGTLTASVSVSTAQLTAGSVRISGNTITTLAGALNFTTASGQINVTGSVIVSDSDFNTTGVVNASTVFGGNVKLTGDTISTADANGTLILAPNGTGVVQVSSHLVPSASVSKDLGASGTLWRTLYLGTSLSNGTNQITTGELLSLRNNLFRDVGRTQAAQTGDALFYDAVSGTWLASQPDAEIDHSTLSGLVTGDAGHTQFVMLAGRAGGQVVQGGTAAANNLILESTANASKGLILFRDALVPSVDNLKDLGSTTSAVRDVYSKGQFFGFRAQNTTTGTLPTASAANSGRLVFATDTQKVLVDVGGSWVTVGSGKYLTDTTWDGVQLTQNFTPSAGTVSDARNALWQLRDNANNYEILGVKITTASSSQVTVTTVSPLPAGSYRLIGIE